MGLSDSEMTKIPNIKIDGIHELTYVHIDGYMESSNGSEGERM